MHLGLKSSDGSRGASVKGIIRRRVSSRWASIKHSNGGRLGRWKEMRNRGVEAAYFGGTVKGGVRERCTYNSALQLSVPIHLKSQGCIIKRACKCQQVSWYVLLMIYLLTSDSYWNGGLFIILVSLGYEVMAKPTRRLVTIIFLARMGGIKGPG